MKHYLIPIGLTLALSQSGVLADNNFDCVQNSIRDSILSNVSQMKTSQYEHSLQWERFNSDGKMVPVYGSNEFEGANSLPSLDAVLAQNYVDDISSSCPDLQVYGEEPFQNGSDVYFGLLSIPISEIDYGSSKPLNLKIEDVKLEGLADFYSDAINSAKIFVNGRLLDEVCNKYSFNCNSEILNDSSDGSYNVISMQSTKNPDYTVNFAVKQ